MSTETSPLLTSQQAESQRNPAGQPLISKSLQSLRLLKSRKAAAYGLSIFSCLCAASFTVFSLYTASFQDLGYSAYEINIISIAGGAGLYLCVPFLGYGADAYRLSYLGIIGSVMYIISYGVCAMTVRLGASYLYTAAGFAGIGVACSAVFICSMVNCARLFSSSALLSISGPTTAYGLSSLIYSQIISHAVDSGTDLSTIFLVLGGLLSLVGLIAFAAPRLGGVDSGSHSTIAEIPVETPISHIDRFVSDPKTWTFLVTFVLVSGPLEMYQNNLGLIGKAINPIHPPPPARQIALFSLFSTVSRLLVGAYTDIYKTPPHKLLIALLLTTATVEWGVAQQQFQFSYSLTSAVSGFSYGSMFTLYPLIVSKVWGIEGFATYWGMFILGPAVGSLLFGLIFAYDFDSNSSYQVTFWLCGLSMLVSAIITTRLAKIW